MTESKQDSYEMPRRISFITQSLKLHVLFDNKIVTNIFPRLLRTFLCLIIFGNPDTCRTFYDPKSGGFFHPIN